MNIKEIYILNRALDGQDIPLLPTFQSQNISNLMAYAIKDGMIKKGILLGPSEFSKLGAAQTNLLLKYKKAKKHIKLNNLYLGIIDETKSILIQWNPLYDDYSIKMIKSSNAVDQIKASYKFLNNTENYSDNKILKISFNDLKNNYDISSNAFNLTTLYKNNKTKEIYLESANKLCIYDITKQSLKISNQSDILETLKERMCCYE